MASFATPAELATFLGLPSVDTPRAQQYLDDATALIREATDQFISSVDNEVILLGSLDRDILILPERPVRAVDVVKVDGVTLAADNYTFTTSGFLQRVKGAETWLATSIGIEVTYDHGFTTVPDDIKSICRASAARALTRNEGGTAEAMGGTFMQTAGFSPQVFLTTGERMALASYGPQGVG